MTSVQVNNSIHAAFVDFSDAAAVDAAVAASKAGKATCNGAPISIDYKRPSARTLIVALPVVARRLSPHHYLTLQTRGSRCHQGTGFVVPQRPQRSRSRYYRHRS